MVSEFRRDVHESGGKVFIASGILLSLFRM